MSISYPLSLPSSPAPMTTRWIEVNIIGNSVSPYTLQRQVYEWSGSAWAIQVGFEPLTRDEAQPFIAFLSQLRGSKGTFLFGDEIFKTPLGSVGGTPRVNGSNQSGYSLVTDGWNNSTLVLKAGDMFQIDNNIYRNLTDATTNGSGQVTLDVFPRLKSHADNSLIVTSNPKGIFRLTDNQINTQEANSQEFYNITFSAVEAI